jgi:hypothetical protein
MGMGRERGRGRRWEEREGDGRRWEEMGGEGDRGRRGRRRSGRPWVVER